MLRYFYFLTVMCLFSQSVISAHSSHHEGSFETLKDKQACQMFLHLCSMRAQKSAHDGIKQWGILGFQGPELMWSQMQVQLTDMLQAYVADKCGICTPDLWQIYNSAQDIVASDFRSFPKHMPQRPISSRKSLLSLAQSMVSKSAERDYHDLKLMTLFRDDATDFAKLIEASFTLHIPLGRAQRRTEHTRTSFSQNLMLELQQDYWRDDGLASVARYLRDYFRYEFLVAKADKELLAKYPGLNSADAASFAQQMLANFIVLYIVQPYLVAHGVQAGKAKEFAEAKGIAIIYGEQPSYPRPFAEAEPVWYKITDLITGDTPPLSRQSSTNTDFSIEEDLSQKMVFSSASTSSPLSPPTDTAARELTEAFHYAAARMNVDSLGHLLDEYLRVAVRDQAVILQTQELIKKYVEKAIEFPLDCGPSFKSLYEKFVQLQELTRSSEHWHSGQHNSIFDKPYTGNVSDYLQRFSDATWQEKVDIYCRLADISLTVGDILLSEVIRNLGDEFSHYAAYLDDDSLIRLFDKFYDLKMAGAFNRIRGYLQSTVGISANPTGIRQLLSGKVLHLASSSSSGFVSPKKRSLKKQQSFKYKVSSKKVEKLNIHYPLDRGIGEIAHILSGSALFEGADSELLMMVARLAEPKRLRQDHLLYKQGDLADSFALITNGELEVLGRGSHSRTVIATLMKGRPVGDMSLFAEDARRTATVKAKTNVTYYEISNMRFRLLMMLQPDLLRFMFAQMVEKVAIGKDRLREANLEPVSQEEGVFCSLSHEQTLKLADFLEKTKQFGKDKLLVRAGQPAENLFYISQGKLAVSRDERFSREIGKGCYYDEIAFLRNDGCHSCDVKASPESGAWLKCLSRKDFKTLAQTHPDILWTLVARLSVMIQENNRRLADTNAYKLQLACKDDREDLAKDAILAGVSVDAPCPLREGAMVVGSRPLHVAALFNSIEVFRHLILAQGADPKVLDDRANNAAHIAAKYGHLRILEILTGNLDVLCAENIAGETPIKLASDNRHQHVVEFLQREGCAVDRKITSISEIVSSSQ